MFSDSNFSKKEAKMVKPPAIAIDLGTSFSCVGVWQHDKVKIQGNRTPSYIAFTNTEHPIGDTDKNQVSMNPSNTVFDTKRLISCKYDAQKSNKICFIVLFSSFLKC